MSYSDTKFTKGVIVEQEGTLTPAQIQVTPGGTASTKTQVVGSQTVDQVLTLPDATDTLVGKATTDTLTNKTIDATSNTISNLADANIKSGAAIDAAKIANGSVSNAEFQYLDGVTSAIQSQLDSKAPSSGATITNATIGDTNTVTLKDVNFTLEDDGDTSKKLQLQLSGITTATTRTLTVPDANTTIVGTDATQTLTNKTLTGNTAANLVNGAATVSLPSTTTTLVGRDTTDTLTNKTLSNDTITGGTIDNAVIGGTTPAAGTFTTLNSTSANVSGVPVVTTTATQTLTNKTLTAPVIDVETLTEQFSTPASPSAGSLKVYAKTDNQLYTLDSTGVETALGSGTGGSKNYLTTYNSNPGNGDLEKGSTTGFSLFTTTLTGLIPSGSISAGAASLSALSVVNSGQLAGKYSLQVSSTGAVSAGQGFITDAFTIDKEDQAKVMTIKAYYNVTSGASNMNFSATSANTWQVYVYDVTNSAWIQPAGAYGLSQTSGTGYVTATFQTTSNSTQYRLAIICINASSGAMTMLWDDFSFGPQTAPIGAAISDWVAYTPTITGFGTPSSVNFKSRRVGDTLQVTGSFFSGTSTSTQALISLGYNGANNNVVTDTTKVSANSLIGTAITGGASATTFTYSILASGSASVSMGVQTSTNSATNLANGNGIATSGTAVEVFFQVPIAGWSSNVQMSNDKDTRVVAASYSSATTNNISAANSSTTAAIIKYQSKNDDTHSAYSTTTGIYTVQVSGLYKITAGAFVNSASGGNWQIAIYKNNSTQTSLSPYVVGGSTQYVSTSIQLPLNAGDTIDVRGNINSGSSIGSVGVNNAGDYLLIERLSGPATIAATESVNARYTNTAGTSVGTTATLIPFATKVFDSHDAYNTTNGLYIAPVSGKYLISCNLLITNSSAFPTDKGITHFVYKNGSLYARLDLRYGNGISANNALSGTTIIDLLAGENIAIYAVSDTSGSTLQATTGSNHISIQRVGN